MPLQLNFTSAAGMKPGFRFFLFACSALALLLDCWGREPADGKFRIAVIPKATTGQFWQTVYAGAKAAAAELGVQMLWVGPEREDQRAEQISMVNTQIANRVDGIVLAPLDGEALLKPVAEAVRAKLPVVIIDSDLVGGSELYASFVATDNLAGGRLAAEQLVKLLNGSGRIALLRHMEGSASTGNREAGFLEAMNKYPDIQVVSQEQYGGREPQRAAENLLLRFTQNGILSVDGIFCPNLTTTYGMLQALRRTRLAGQVKLVGFDSDASLVQGLESGEIHGLVIQDPFNIGYLGVQTMVRHLKGEAVQKRADTGVVYVKASNLQEPAIQALLFPERKHGRYEPTK